MLTIPLSKSDLALLKVEQRVQRDKKAYVKITSVLMIDQGFTPEQAADILGIDASSVRRHLDAFKASSSVTDYLQQHYQGSKPKLDTQQLGDLCDMLTERLFRTAAEVAAAIRERFDIEYTPRGVRHLIKRLGFVFKKTRLVASKSDPMLQQQFLDNELRPLHERTARAAEPLYFCDAVHPQHNTRSCFGWIARGEDFIVDANSGRDRININGAINAHDLNDVVAIESNRIDAEATIQLFEELQRRHPHGAIHVVCDNARYNHSRLLRQWLADSRIVVTYLPPYSPNLNLIERLWKLMRSEILDATYYEHKEQFRQAVRGFFKNISLYKEKISTLLAFDFHIEDAFAN